MVHNCKTSIADITSVNSCYQNQNQLSLLSELLNDPILAEALVVNCHIEEENLFMENSFDLYVESTVLLRAVKTFFRKKY